MPDSHCKDSEKIPNSKFPSAPMVTGYRNEL